MENNNSNNTAKVAGVSKRERERAEIHKAIWNIANNLRGSVDGWDFKSYVLGTMFYRFLSEKISRLMDEIGCVEQLGNHYFELEDNQISDDLKGGLIDNIGFYLLPSQLFCNVLNKARASKEYKEQLNESLTTIFKSIENSAKEGTIQDSRNFSGLFDDFKTDNNVLGKTVVEKNNKLFALLDEIGKMKLGEEYDKNDIDPFGDAYEYLMAMYASNAGKSGGEFFTPQEVSKLLTGLCISKFKKDENSNNNIETVYDPCAGSGSLLLQAYKQLRDTGLQEYPKIFGQEINPTTYNLCRINMFLHDISYNDFTIYYGDTLLNPQRPEEYSGFDLIVSNPPYSIKWQGKENPNLVNDPRFVAGLAPASKADLAFVSHMYYFLNKRGIAAIVCFPGVMYRGGSEKKIRQYFVDNNAVSAVIQLPDNLFFGTSIATCILILEKDKKDDKVVFIDASNEYVRETNNNKLTDDNINNIIKAYVDKENVDHYVSVVTNEEIAKSDYNLSVSNYVRSVEVREEIDIHALNKEIEEIVKKEEELRAEINRIIAVIEGKK